jgi:lipopolysaccharide export system protein LptA
MSKRPTSPSPARRSIEAMRYGVILALCGALAAHAEKADRDKPINVEADKVTLDDLKKVSTFEGNVILIQGTLRIVGDRVVVRQDKDGGRYATAWGKPVTFRQKLDNSEDYVDGVADRIEYDGRVDKVELFNKAVLHRGQDELHGNYISYEAKTDFFLVNGSAAGTSSTPASTGRVKAVIQPPPPNSKASGAKDAGN